MRVGPWIAATALATAVLAGCGSASNYNNSVGVAAPPGTDVPQLAAAVSSGASAGTGSALPSAATGGTSGGSTAFCRDLATGGSSLATPGGAVGLGSIGARERAALATLQREAPKALRPALRILVRVADRVLSDLTARPPKISDIAGAEATPGYLGATQQLRVYVATNCGINLAPPGG